jgi:D-arabinose 1-dehydrogenase-like Zn-dependent alcohol dehydrogenase
MQPRKLKGLLLPTLLNNDIVIDIQYCGICHSDIHQVKDEWGGSTFPIVPGHEIAGIVSQVGLKVSPSQWATEWA